MVVFIERGYVLNDVCLIRIDVRNELRVGHDDASLHELVENESVHAVHVVIVIDIVGVVVDVDILVIELGFCGILIVVVGVLFVFMAGLRIHR